MSAERKIIAMIGSGCASAECIMVLRKNGYRGEIHLFTDSKWPIYNPMLTTYYAAGKITFDQLFPYGKEDFFNKYKVHVHPDSPVVAMDHEEKTITNEDGLQLKYDKCLIASGASPFLPPIKGIESKKVYTIREVDNAIRLKNFLQGKPKKALVIGASMIGIKMVELFYQQGMEVCLIDLAEHIFPLAAHPECARLIEDRLTEKGIELKFGAELEKIEDTARGVKVSFKNCRETKEADLLFICIGVRANIAFVNPKQVEVDKGILIDSRMRTNLPDLYAAGDVAQGKNLLTGKRQIIGLWANARFQGQNAGKNMAGIKGIFHGNIPHNITHFLGMDFVGIGDVYDYDKVERKFDGRQFSQLFWKGGSLTGVNLLDNYTESGVLKNALVNRLLNGGHAYFHSLPAIQNVLTRKILTEVK